MITTLLLLTSLSHAAQEPCYGFSEPNRVEGENFWVEWQTGVATEEDALQRIEFAEAARKAYIDLGWRFSDRTILLSIVGNPRRYGRTETRDCEGVDVPIIFLFSSRGDGEQAYSIPGRNTTMHEVAHTVQYAYMGDHRDSVASWLWWMEASATALTYEADGNLDVVARREQDFLDHPQLALHQNVTAFLVPDRSRHMYGTAIFVRFIRSNYGGTQTLQALWEYGAGRTGEVIWFPDAMASVDLDFGEVWRHFMAMTTVVDLPDEGALGAPPVVESGLLDVPIVVSEADGPQGLGLSYVLFPGFLGKRSKALQISFRGDPTVPWNVVLVRTSGSGAGSQVLDYAAIDVVDGVGEGWVSGFDGGRTGAFVVASPVDSTLVGRSFQVTGSLISDKGPMDSRVVLVEREPTGCGCAAGGAGWLWLWVPLLGAMRRRRARRDVGC